MDFRIKMFADGADIAEISILKMNPQVTGFTTNPTLMAKAGVKDYRSFAIEVAKLVNPLPISFEVISDDLDEMYKQANIIKSWGNNIYVKIPVTNTKGISTANLISELSKQKISLNVTAIMNVKQVELVCSNLSPDTPSIISVFAGRIADTGKDPLPVMKDSLLITSQVARCELLWASPREILNLVQAESIGCQIITMTTELWKKFDNLGRDLDELSLATINMFYNDAVNSNLTI
jgi:transaldolase